MKNDRHKNKDVDENRDEETRDTIGIKDAVSPRQTQQGTKHQRQQKTEDQQPTK